MVGYRSHLKKSMKLTMSVFLFMDGSTSLALAAGLLRSAAASVGYLAFSNVVNSSALRCILYLMRCFQVRRGAFASYAFCITRITTSVVCVEL